MIKRKPDNGTVAFSKSVVIVLFILGCTWGASAQTSIVAVRTPEEVAGADSKVTYIRKPPGVACKIFPAQGAYYALAGMVINPITGFDVTRSINHYLTGPDLLITKLKALETFLNKRLAIELEAVRKVDPEQFLTIAQKEDGNVLQIAVVAIEQETPKVFTINFQAGIDGESKTISIKSSSSQCPGDCPSEVQAYFLGTHQVIDRYMATNHPKGSVSTVINTLIQMEIDDPVDGKKVGAPIDILLIDAKGAHWLQRKKECPDLLQEKKPN